jgi:hypothetical protein
MNCLLGNCYNPQKLAVLSTAKRHGDPICRPCPVSRPDKPLTHAHTPFAISGRERGSAHRSIIFAGIATVTIEESLTENGTDNGGPSIALDSTLLVALQELPAEFAKFHVSTASLLWATAGAKTSVDNDDHLEPRRKPRETGLGGSRSSSPEMMPSGICPAIITAAVCP